MYVSYQKFENSMDFLHVIDDDKSHYVYIKDFKIFMFHKTKNKNKKYFRKSCLRCFSSENALTKHKKDCLSINGAQSVKLDKRRIEFKNFSNTYQLHLKFMLILSVVWRGVKFMKVLRQRGIKINFLQLCLESSLRLW